MGTFDGKTVIITGGALGIGSATAAEFALEGARVVIADVNAEAGQAVVSRIEADGGECILVEADVGRAAECKRVVAETVAAYGGVDILFNNVGIQSPDSYHNIENTSEELWDRILDVNLKSAFLMSKYAIPEIRKKGGGVIVNTASVQGLQSMKLVPAYAASKGGILSLTQADGPGLRGGEHPRARRVPRHHRHQHGTHRRRRGGWGHRCDCPGVGSIAPHRAGRHRPGHRQRRAVPRQRKGLVHDRRVHLRRRRLHGRRRLGRRGRRRALTQARGGPPMHYQNERNHGCRVSDAWTYRGLKTVVMENELLRVVVLADKGADILELVHKPTDVDFLWRSPWGVRDPSKFVPTTGSPLGLWMDFYEGGWQTVFPAGGFPSAYGGADLGLHAEASMAPWDCRIVDDAPDKVSIRCSIRTVRLPFYFEKTLTLKSGSPMLEVDEYLVNEGRETVPCVWGEHIAIGAPTLSGDSIIDLPGGTLLNHPDIGDTNARLKPDFRGTWPWTEDKDGNRIDLSKVPPPSIEAYDMSYITDMPEGWYGLTNLSTGVGLGVVFPKDVFKFLWYWQSLGGGYGYPWYGRTYNVGLEPFTSFANEGLGSAIENGTALNVAPGQRIDATVKVIAYTDAHRGVESIAPDGAVAKRP